MAASKKRETQAYKVPRNFGKAKSENPKWLVPTIVGLLILGLVWIITYYVSSGGWPLPIGNYNLMAGFVFLIVAMGLLTRWR